MSSIDTETMIDSDNVLVNKKGKSQQQQQQNNGNEEIDKASRRREQIAAASRKSRERRKIELMNLKKENTLLWEQVELLNSQLKNFGAESCLHEQLSSLKHKRSLDDLSHSSSDDEGESNQKLVTKKQKLESISPSNINAATSSTLPLLMQPQMLNPLSAIEQGNNIQRPQFPQLPPFSINSEGRIITPPSIASAMLAASTFARTFQDGIQNNLNSFPLNLNLNQIGMKSQFQTNPKLAPIISFAETRANWFLNQFKVDLISSFGDALTQEEKLVLEKMTAKLFSN